MKEPLPPPAEPEALLEADPTEAIPEAPPPEAPRMAGQAGLVGALTLLSRIFGLLRDSMIAYVLGTRAAADAFYVAFRIPNLLRRMLAEGNLTLSFVPVFTESLHRSKEEAKEVADITFTILLFLLSLISIAGVLGAVLFVKMTAWGFAGDPEKFALTTSLTRITFPYILLVSIGALFMGILNARKHFAAPAFAPVLMNLGIILGAWLLSPLFSNPSTGIAWGVIVGGVLQLAIQVPPLIRQGFLPRLNFHWKHPAVKKIGRLMLPTLYGSAVYQLNLLAITFLGSFLPTGSISYLWYADRVVEFPLGIFAVSLATVVLPTLSDHAAKKNHGELVKTFRQALSMVWIMNIPAAIGMAVLAKTIVAVLFYRGGFTQESTALTASALRFFVLGLPFVSASRIIASAFYAQQEAKKPVIAANVTVVVNIVAGFLLLGPMQHRGLALAVSLGSVTNFLVLMYLFRKQTGALGLTKLAVSVLKILLAAGIMGGALAAVLHYWDLSFARTLPRMLFLMALISGGALLYALLVLALRIEGADVFLAAMRRRFARR